MVSLEELYSVKSCNPKCTGCTILSQKKSSHSIMDYEKIEECNTLFLSDSLRAYMGSYVAFSKPEYDLIASIYPDKFVTAASVKCPNVKEKDISTDDQKICRAHLEDTINKIKPKLIFVCGNLPMKMLLKKSGITDKRGRTYEYSTETGHKCYVVPIFNPYSVVVEPKNKYLFEVDMLNAYNFYIKGQVVRPVIEYKVLTNDLELLELEPLITTTEPISCDLETEGFNFLTDKILTVAISHQDKTWVIPVYHKESPFNGEVDGIIRMLRRVLANSNNKKIFHNAKFDLKFLLNLEIEVANPWDTKIMQHAINENIPRSLKQLVKLYFPEYLETL